MQTSEQNNQHENDVEQNQSMLSIIQSSHKLLMTPDGNKEQGRKTTEWTQVTRKGKSKGRGPHSPRETSSEQMLKAKTSISQMQQVGDPLEQQSLSPELVTGLAKRVRFIDGLAGIPPQLEQAIHCEGANLCNTMQYLAKEGENQKEPLTSIPGLNAGSFSSSPC